MAKGAPTAEAGTNYGVTAAPGIAKPPVIAPGNAMTASPAANGSGQWIKPVGQPANITAQWQAPTPAVPNPVAANPMSARDKFAQVIAAEVNASPQTRRSWNMGYGDGGGRGGGYTTSGRDSWGGSSGGRAGGYW